MCLAVPGKVVSIEASKAVVDILGNRRPVDVTLVKAGVGDWVLVHAGIAIQVLDQDQAAASVAAYKDLMDTVGMS